MPLYAPDHRSRRFRSAGRRAEQARRRAEAAKEAEVQRAKGERRAKNEVQRRLAQLEKGSEILASVFENLNPLVAEAEGVPSRDLLCERICLAARQLEGDEVGDPLVVARLQHVLGNSLFELGYRDQAERLLRPAAHEPLDAGDLVAGGRGDAIGLEAVDVLEREDLAR